MSSAYINNLKYTFKQSPDKTPSVEIKFSGTDFNYENGLSTKLNAQYAVFSNGQNLYSPLAISGKEEDEELFFSQDYLSNYFHEGLKNILCPGFDEIYIRCRKTSSLGNNILRFEFYLENPYTSDDVLSSFAVSSCQISNTNTNKNLYTSVIYNTSNTNIGNLTFYYQAVIGDEIFDMTTGDYKLFKYELSDSVTWNDATLFYKDLTSDDIFVEDLFNHYPVNEDGTIDESKNYWDFTKDLQIGTNDYYCLRVCLIDTNNSSTMYQSSIISSANGRYRTNELAYFIPVFQYNREEEFNPEYSTSDTPFFSLIVPSDDKDYQETSSFMNKIIYYRFAENINAIDEANWEMFSSVNGETVFSFYMSWLGGGGTGGEILDGEKTIVLQISDGLGNVSEIVKYDNEITEGESGYEDYLWKKDSVREIYLYREKPNSIVFNVIGSSGNEYYTGMYRDETGKFIASNKILVNVYAKDNLNLPLEYKLYLGNSSSTAEWRNFDYPNDESTYYNIPFYLDSESNYGIFDNNYSANVNLVFRNSAGNSSDVITKNIFFNSVILKSDKMNLRETSNSYKPVIEYYNGDEYVQINERENFDVTIPKRSWNEIFYPETHSFPVDASGNIDVSEAVKIADGNTSFDAVKTETITYKDEDNKDVAVTKIVYDDEQRPITIWNEYVNTKLYRGLQSNQKTYNSETGETEGLVYWIIDNTGYTDFQLEFEHFHLDQTSHIQINDLAPFTGDCLVVYDASAEGSTTEYIDQYGRTAYKLVDTTKLKMLSAYSGDGVNAVQLYPESSVGSLNATANGAFVTEKFNSTSRICLIFYSDGAGEKSGFKIKASPARESDWTNWEVDNKRGEIWLHKIDTEILEGNSFSTLTTNAGYCPDQVRMSYEYSETSFDIDYESGAVRFYEKPEGQVWGTFSHYNYSVENGPYKVGDNGEKIPITSTFALADDDLVDYKDLSIYSSHIQDNKIQIDKNNIYDFTDGSYGKIITNIITYKDSGLIKFENNLPPKNRIFADYYNHSFYRLTDDGYGNLYFYDDIIVPDKTENYPDFTYVDLKVVNEGEATLRNGKIKFTFRGIATGTNATTITSVLNPDRPWDIQSGTPEETFDQVGGVVSANYNFPTMTWDNALAIYEGSVDIDSETTLTGGKTEINFGVQMEMKREIFLRVVWTMFKGGNENSPEYITPSTAGEKCFSGEIEGSFYTVQI